jgi:hypothetical protein
MNQRRLSRDVGRGHLTLPLPSMAGQVMSVGGQTASMAHDQVYFAGLTPILVPPYAWMIHRIWCVFETADAGASGENYTEVDFLMGSTIAGATSVGTINTLTNPAAGEPLVKYLKAKPEYGKILYAVPAVVGTGGTDLSGAGFGFGFDFLPVRSA